jgi:polar amino acid transport system substrate-binding protein
MKKKKIWVFGSVVLALGFLPVLAQKAAVYGACPVYGKAGIYKISPLVAGQLTVQTNLPGPGFFNGLVAEKVHDGFEYCLAANLAHRLGLKTLVVQNVAWDHLIAAKTTNFDLAFSQITITNERKAIMDFSSPYFSSSIGVLVRGGDLVNAENIKSKKIGVQSGTTAQDFATKRLKPTEAVQEFADVSAATLALKNRVIDVFLIDTAIALARASQSGGVLAVKGQYGSGEEYGAMFKKGSKSQSAVNRALAAMKKDQTIAKLAEKYLGGDPWKIPVWRP